MISALIELMNNYYHSGDFSQLGAVARTLLGAVPDDIVSAHFLAFAYIKTGRHHDALRLFDRLRRKLPGRLRPARGGGQVQQAEAICLSEATERNPDYAPTWHSLALELEQMEQPAEAIAMLRLAIAACPGYADALRNLGRIGLAAGDLDAAHEGYAGLLQVVPGDADALRGLQQVLELRMANRKS